MDYLYKDETYKIIGACMEVHSKLGSGFLEPIYQEALEIEFDLRKIPYEREKPLTVHYKDKPLEKKYLVDFVCYDKVIVELKAVSEVTPVHEAQLLNYMKASSIKVGLLVNFASPSLVTKRLVL